MNLIPDDIDWAEYERETEETSKVKPAADFLADMIAAVGRPKGREMGAKMPWEKTHNVFAFRPGEVTLWGGVNGHGKSAISGMCAVSLMVQGEKVGIASFEMKPVKTLDRMTRQQAGQDLDCTHPDEIPVIREVLDDFRAHSTDKLWFYDQQGTVTPQKVIAVVRYMCKALGIKHVFVDSLMKCVKNEDDYNGQKYVVDEFCAIAKDYDAHIHLIHHLRKGGKESELPDKSDVKGSGSITDQVDNLLLVWRNKPKEDDIAAGKYAKGEEADSVIFCKKQRNGTGWEGAIQLWFHKPSMQYVGSPGALLDMARWPHYERTMQ